MYTGIVQGRCEVVQSQRDAGLIRLGVRLRELADGLQLGASVALNGVCLTVASIAGDVVAFDLIRETATLTNLGAVQPHDEVNVERSFVAGDEVGGHIVSGHVACMVEVCDIRAATGHRRVSVAVPQPWRRYLLPKGFVALDGVSLTVADLDRDAGTATVSLIPETLARTGFGRATVGDRLNLEVDSHTQAVVDTVRDLLSDPALVREMLA